MALVLAIVSERTGYPPETLGPDLDLEADLSIDSIKRIEIVGELASRLGLKVAGGGNDAMVEELATRKTLRGLVDWLAAKLGAPSPGAVVAELAAGDTVPVAVPVAAPAPTPAPIELGRFVFSRITVPTPSPRDAAIAGRTLVVVDDGLGVAPHLAPRLAAGGADVQGVAASDRIARPDVHGLIDLTGLATTAQDGDGATAAMTAMFDHVKHAVVGGASSLLVATGLGAIAMVAACAVLGLRVTFLDFVALPITFGLGVDYTINLVHDRAAAASADPALAALRGSGSAVFVCSLTTIIGYGSLLVSDNQAIRAFGTASLVGEVCCLATAMLVAPAILAVGARARATAAVPASSSSATLRAVAA